MRLKISYSRDQMFRQVYRCLDNFSEGTAVKLYLYLLHRWQQHRGGDQVEHRRRRQGWQQQLDQKHNKEEEEEVLHRLMWTLLQEEQRRRQGRDQLESCLPNLQQNE